MKESNNPSAIRSKELITNALFELMKRKPFNTITISELVLSCDLTRKTFYRNYTGKEDVLDSYLEELYRNYQEELSKLTDFAPYPVLHTYFSFCRSHLDFFMVLEKQNLLVFLLPKFDEFLQKIGSNYQNLDTSEPSTTYHITFSTGGFWYLLCKWLHNGAVETPEEMAELCCQFL